MMKKIALCLALSVGLSSPTVRAEGSWVTKGLLWGATALLAGGLAVYFKYLLEDKKQRFTKEIAAGYRSTFDVSSLKKKMTSESKDFDLMHYRSDDLSVYVCLNKKLVLSYLGSRLSKGPITRVTYDEAQNKFKTEFVTTGKKATTVVGNFMVLVPHFETVEGNLADTGGMVTYQSFDMLSKFAANNRGNIKKIVIGLDSNDEKATDALANQFDRLTLYFNGMDNRFKKAFPNAREIYLLSTGLAVDYYNQLQSNDPAGSVAGLFYFPLK